MKVRKSEFVDMLRAINTPLTELTEYLQDEAKVEGRWQKWNGEWYIEFDNEKLYELLDDLKEAVQRQINWTNRSYFP